MTEQKNIYNKLVSSLRLCTKIKTNKLEVKKNIAVFYNSLATQFRSDLFFNWGMHDFKLEQELLEKKIDFIINLNEIKSTWSVLSYYLIEPLVKSKIFNKAILDIGTGNGIGLRLSSKLLKSKVSFGLDLSNKLLINASKNTYRDNSIYFINGDAEYLPLKDNSFDIITSLESSHLYPEPELFFQEVFRVLKPGGFFCYADFSVAGKDCEKVLESLVVKEPLLKIISKTNITSKVQQSIYNHLVVNEDKLYNIFLELNDGDHKKSEVEFSKVIQGAGANFLPWWQKRFKNKYCNKVINSYKFKSYKHWLRKYYYCYIVAVS